MMFLLRAAFKAAAGFVPGGAVGLIAIAVTVIGSSAYLWHRSVVNSEVAIAISAIEARLARANAELERERQTSGQAIRERDEARAMAAMDEGARRAEFDRALREMRQLSPLSDECQRCRIPSWRLLGKSDRKGGPDASQSGGGGAPAKVADGKAQANPVSRPK